MSARRRAVPVRMDAPWEPPLAEGVIEGVRYVVTPSFAVWTGYRPKVQRLKSDPVAVSRTLALLAEDPGRSNRVIARLGGLSAPRVAQWRRFVEVPSTRPPEEYGRRAAKVREQLRANPHRSNREIGLAAGASTGFAGEIRNAMAAQLGQLGHTLVSHAPFGRKGPRGRPRSARPPQPAHAVGAGQAIGGGVLDGVRYTVYPSFVRWAGEPPRERQYRCDPAIVCQALALLVQDPRRADRAIAQTVGLSRLMVSLWRRFLGLPASGSIARETRQGARVRALLRMNPRGSNTDIARQVDMSDQNVAVIRGKMAAELGVDAVAPRSREQPRPAAAGDRGGPSDRRPLIPHQVDAGTRGAREPAEPVPRDEPGCTWCTLVHRREPSRSIVRRLAGRSPAAWRGEARGLARRVQVCRGPDS